MPDSVLDFYEGLAEEYHLLFADWEQSVERQGAVLDALLRRSGAPPPRRVLDCACGIGTQALGLAARGFGVHATDLSPSAVARAEREARAMHVSITTGVADMRMLDWQVPDTFDVVMACDNALAHLLEDSDLQDAANAMASRLVPGGLLVASLRDNAALLEKRPRFTAERVLDTPLGRRVLFQVWDWAVDDRQYTVRQFILRQESGIWHTTEHTGIYRLLERLELERALTQAGLVDPRWYSPEESGFYQPLITVRKP
ncbi:class I SAM-dependent methyltransferase [Corallococcus praedator]|uniref:Class I SAM-dependent methyltransferase n=1 Tax=Corallococcus praedator TaxID=2316724 RepID=A0ABX9QLY7_9BACT|nr:MULTISPECIES: class I SAM-dependent methyltransferase [Corallococcus]RKH18577.1 class I SAM-dependent methyltransferase [Corallococcus sp. CA047B]RKH26966.1 class I SAM-dependent methyltransferase [Corallococcus sp. CA031C]RKI12168.1 class I SAM-dependent methyltransferase [Corallococcus praedator]